MDDVTFFKILLANYKKKLNPITFLNLTSTNIMTTPVISTTLENSLRLFDNEMQNMIENDKDRKNLLQMVDSNTVLDFELVFNSDVFVENRINFIGSGSFGNALIVYMGRRRMKKIIKAIRCVPKPLINNIITGAMTYADVHKELMCLKILSQLSYGIRIIDERNEESFDGDFIDFKQIHKQNKRFLFKVNCFPLLYKAYLCRNESKAMFNFESLYSFDNFRPIYEKFETALILMEHCGTPLYKLIENNEIDLFGIISVLKQIIIGLAIAESIFYFEHRDLHSSNITCKSTNCSNSLIKFVYKSEHYQILSFGFEAKIIDFSYSRITYNDCIYYKDLSFIKSNIFNKSDPKGPYEEMALLFENDHWNKYSNKSNIIWIRCLLKEIIESIEIFYKKPNQDIINYLKSIDKIAQQAEDVFHLFNHLLTPQYNYIVSFQCY